ncbi:MAG: F0F1 ATP synthase subunit B [Clostridiales bacterium]|nr:F0F1 ATP synthase subunit B [Clostridiales bacterium]
MTIDWFTISAQAVNFLVLIWLMKRFLYKPILKAIDEREKNIADTIAAAGSQEASAQAQRQEFLKKNEEFDHQRAQMLSQATHEAHEQRRRLVDEANKEADALREQRQESLLEDARRLSRAIGLRTQEEVFAIARKALSDLSSNSLEESMCKVFIRRLRDMDGKEKETLDAALGTKTETALVTSAFDLPKEQRMAIQNALNDIFQADIRMEFKTMPELIGGIELAAKGQKIAWNIADYINSMEKNVDELIKQGRPNPS